MKLNDETMLKFLREEYDKRINHYLGEVEVKAKHSKSDSELVNDAYGLKVKNRAGFLFTIVKIEQEENGSIFAYLTPPGGYLDYENVEGGKRISSSYEEENIEDDYLVGDEESDDEFIYSNVSEDEGNKIDKNEPNQQNDEAKQKNKKLKASKGDIIEPSDKAKFKKQLKIDVGADVASYEEVNGLIKVSLKELEDNFTL
tara:strand:- start:1159 stop:1758 length:600 start_codon:yes stop_codon:yes gene_type:complete